MDHMLPSPGFSIPSIGTPLHQPEADQMILPTAVYQQEIQMNNPSIGMGQSMAAQQQTMAQNFNNVFGPDIPMNNVSGGLSGGVGLGNSSSGVPPLVSTTSSKQMQSYQPSYSTPQSLMQPQTPVS